MHNFVVPKNRLLEILKANREKHRSVFLKAQENYRKIAIDLMDQMLKDAREGGPVRKRINLDAPTDHTSDYDSIIGLLELSLDVNVDLSLQEYQMYVQDQWHWAKDLVKNTNYAAFVGVGEGGTLPGVL